MATVAGGGVRVGGGGCFVRFSGDHSRHGHPHPHLHRHRHQSSNLSFRTCAAVEGREKIRSATPTFYELLGITSRDGLEEVKKAYKRMARKYHPDVSPPDCTVEHTRMFIEVQEAYETLSDPYRRSEYDKQLARGFTRVAFRARHFDQEMEAKEEWKRRWQDQISELHRRSDMKQNVSDENLSWAERMRRRRAAGASIG
ncbi:Chaperone protein DnaJ [Rhynchospora pubera]|uniref:Chaperone protein DnaJ n=1 Tax=Rhynchospora pubera TaxID=906938 RepID=A0AAV8D193_9POAL|nr:Chaperone protein DnaJ [Rhynchospora pubera]